jgi:hypothetical protein
MGNRDSSNSNPGTDGCPRMQRRSPASLNSPSCLSLAGKTVWLRYF